MDSTPVRTRAEPGRATPARGSAITHHASRIPSLETPPVLAIVVAYNGLVETLGCLEALAAQVYPTLEIHLVDNGSTDGTPARVAAAHPDVVIHALGENRGFAAAANVGLRVARERGAYALLLNNDTRFEPDLVARLVARATADPSIGLLSPLVLYETPPGRIWASGFDRHRLLLESRGGHRGEIDTGQVDPERDWDYLLGCALLVRPELIEQVGLLDERFFFTYEDLDYSIRARRAGWRLCCEPGARLLHRVSATAGEDSPLQNYHLGQASVRFFAKHAPRLARPPIFLFRLASAARRLGRLARAGKWDAARAYLRGLATGWRTRGGHR